MSRKSVPPGEGPRRCTHFPYCSTDNGDKWFAYVAGPPWWVVAHGEKRTTVCPHWLTDGELRCSHCELGQLALVKGYVPLYRAVDSHPCCVLVYEDVRHQVDKLRFHQRVIVGRGRDATSTVYVVPAMEQEPHFKTVLRERMQEADVTRSCIAFWRNAGVAAWYWRENPDLAPPLVVATGAGGSSARPARLAAELKSAPKPVLPPQPPTDDDAPANAVMKAAIARMKERERAAKNGKPDVTE